MMSATSVRNYDILIVAMTQSQGVRRDRHRLVADQRHPGLLGTSQCVPRPLAVIRAVDQYEFTGGPAGLKGEAHATSPSFCRF